MNLLFPTIKPNLLPTMFGTALLGGLVGGVYGIGHDLCTYSISSEYFTRLKFNQFSFANVGLPPQLFAAEIGFIAVGAVGFIAGWFLARTALPVWPFAKALPRMLAGFGLIALSALLLGLFGYWLGLHHNGDYSYWQDICDALGVTDVPRFVRVAYIHNAGYLGGFVGLLLSIFLLRRAIRIEQRSDLQA